MMIIFPPVLTYQTPCFRHGVQYRQRRRIVRIKRSIQQVTQFVIQLLLPFIVRQLPALDFSHSESRTLDIRRFTSCVTHFKRTVLYGICEIHQSFFLPWKVRTILPSGTGCNNDEVGLLPSKSSCNGYTAFQTTQNHRLRGQLSESNHRLRQ